MKTRTENKDWPGNHPPSATHKVPRLMDRSRIKLEGTHQQTPTKTEAETEFTLSRKELPKYTCPSHPVLCSDS